MTDAALHRSDLRPDWLMERHRAAFTRDITKLAKRRSEFVAINCPACGSDVCSPAFEKTGFPYVACGACETIYMSPRPDPTMIAAHYREAENLRFWVEHVYPATKQPRTEKVLLPRLHRIRDCCDRTGAPRTLLLEVGFGFDSIADIAVDQGVFTKAIAASPGFELGPASSDAIRSSIEDLGADGSTPKASVAACFDLIELMYRPQDLLAALHPLLDKDGVFLLSCPNALGFDILTLGAKSPTVSGEYLNYFTPKGLSNLLSRCGFEAIEIQTPGQLDAELVRDAVLSGEFSLAGQRFLRQILIDDWEHRGRQFQEFLSSSNLSSHMWCIAKPVPEKVAR